METEVVADEIKKKKEEKKETKKKKKQTVIAERGRYRVLFAAYGEKPP